jgi:hypothetical protein
MALCRNDATLPQQVQNDVETVGPQIDLELVVQREVRESDQWASVNEVDDVNTAKVLFNIENPPV